MDLINKINKISTIWEILPDLTVKQLEAIIKLASDSYYNSHLSLLSDSNYDILVDRLKELKPNAKVLNVGAPIRGKKIKLPYWMGSMDKMKSDNSLIEKWINIYKGPYLISDKLDGISCLLIIKNGQIFLYTRGDGKYGQNISHLLNFCNISINYLINEKINTVIRGELIMTKENFKKYEKIMANARNMVAGIVNSKEKSLNKRHAKDVDFVAYEIIDPILAPFNQMKQLNKWRLNVVQHDLYESIVLEILHSILEKRKKKSIYEIDGIIITDNNRHVRNTTGNPSYSFAFKGMTPTADVKVIEVLWKPQKDGHIIPRIHFEKVHLSQVDLEYTTGFNANFIEKNFIGPGAIITIIRSGDVIPYITRIKKPSKISGFPNVSYIWDKNHVNIILKNVNKNKNVIIIRLVKFMRDIGVENMSEGIITKLVNNGFNTVPKLMKITISDMIKIDGFGLKLAKKLYNNIQKRMSDLNVLVLMVASNCFGRGFAEAKIKKILDTYPNIVNEYKVLDKAKWREKLMSLYGFDKITTDKFLISLPIFIEFYKIVEKITPIKKYIIQISSKKFENQIIVFTGFRNINWKEFIENGGGKVTTNVSKNTTLLIYNDDDESSSKFLMAKKLGIKVIKKSDFAKKFNL
uniref:DNA ligase (NAD(+)) n=1 Tax=viral metagenome TaxID=1070528 RepID=A0A6C0LRN3_9ZZZZ